MEDSIQYAKNKSHNHLEGYSMEELQKLVAAHPYSANVQWEMIKRKLKAGTLTDSDLTAASLHMKDRRAFFRAVESLRIHSTLSSVENPINVDSYQINITPGFQPAPEPPESDPTETKAEHSETSALELDKSEDSLASEEIADDTREMEDQEETTTGNEDTEATETSPQVPESQIEPEDQDAASPLLSVEKSTPVKQINFRTDSGSYAKVAESELLLSNHQQSSLSPFTSWLKSLSAESVDDETESPDSEIESESSLPNYKQREGENEKNISEIDVVEKAGKKEGGKKKKKKKKKPETAQELELRPDVISETLADLLASQGHIEDANEMYRRLSRKYPEKSSYFASKIKNS